MPHEHARAPAKPPPTMSIPFGGGPKAYNSVVMKRGRRFYLWLLE